MCLTPSGKLIITDYNNNYLKKLRPKIASKLKIVVSCLIISLDNTRLALTLINFKKVQLVSQQSLELKESFAVRDRCGRIACYEGQIYVYCGGSKNKQEGPGHIEVLKLKGELLRTYYEGISCPTSDMQIMTAC